MEFAGRSGSDCKPKKDRREHTGNASIKLHYCQGISTLFLSFERETGKWSGWKRLRRICEFSETERWGVEAGVGSWRRAEEVKARTGARSQTADPVSKGETVEHRVAG